MMFPLLSKSRFISGLQCPLRLWYQCYHRDLATPVSASQQAIFDMGHEVGELATRLYPYGRWIAQDPMHHKEAVAATKEALADPTVDAIFEAAFLEDGIRVRADILERCPGGRWDLIEVKSSTGDKEVYHYDIAVQNYVLRRAGLDPDRSLLMHINNQYVYDGERLDLGALFMTVDLTETAAMLQAEVVQLLDAQKKMLAAGAPPETAPSRHCKKPYPCEFLEHCTRDLPEHCVLELSGISQGRLDELADLGVKSIREIPEGYPLSPIHQRIRDCVVENREYFSDSLAGELVDVQYPIYFLDFETTGSAIPMFAGTRPYQTIPFQWSVHILHSNGELRHEEYLCTENKDPRRELCEKLIHALGPSGTIYIYTTYETSVLRELAAALPEYGGETERIIGRFTDLYAIIRKNYYHPDFHGSFSLKAVLPALVPDMGYEQLEIQEGNQASVEYLRMIAPGTPVVEKERIRQNLLKYCKQDTLAMVKLRDELIRRSGT